MHIHVLGICGTFMAGLAVLARAAGHRVTGCDANVYPPMSTLLEQQGIGIIQGFEPEQMSVFPDLWVIGNVVSRGNRLMEAILDRGDRYTSGPQWLAEELLRGKSVIAVAGTHGKTTTASMLAWILDAAGANPGFLIGGVPENFGTSARLTPSAHFVIEADEYDTAFFDKRSKFVHYRPEIAVLNNLEFDHADIFPDIAAIETQFHHLVRTVPSKGLLIANARDPAIERVLARGTWTPVERFACDAGDASAGAEWTMGAERADGFDVFHSNKRVGHVEWDLMGAHNRANALAAIAATNRAGIDPRIATQALARFANVKRRMEIRGVARGVTVYDDFAHHPTAIATTLDGLREKVGRGRIIAVLEPRSNTMKLGVMKEALAKSLDAADRVFCYSGELGWDAGAALAGLGGRATVEADFERLLSRVVGELRPGDHVLVMSNGAFNGLHAKLLERLGRD